MSQVFDGERNPADDEKYDLEEPFKYFRVGEEYPGTRDLASTELLSLLPGQQSWMNHQTLRLDFEGQNQEIVSIVLQVDASPGCGGVVWPAGQILSSYLIKKGSSYLRGMRVLDLGSGTGLVGLVAASLGADTVWITDQAPLVGVMRQNLSLNNLENCTAAELDWGASIPPTIPRPDVILAADCVYFEPAFPLLIKTLAELSTKETIILFCYKKRRKADKRFFSMLKKLFSWTEVIDDPNRDIYVRESITLIRLFKLK